MGAACREIDPLAVPERNIGWILFLSRHYDDAIREYRNDLAVAPDDADIRWQLGFALIAIDQPADAVPVLEKALADSNRSPGVICVLIRAYAHAGGATMPCASSLNLKLAARPAMFPLALS